LRTERGSIEKGNIGCETVEVGRGNTERGEGEGKMGYIDIRWRKENLGNKR